MDGARGPVAIRAWKPPVPGVREVLHATFREHAYPPHTHDTWTLFIVDRGAIRYDLDRHHRGADVSIVSLLPPHVVHDGRPGQAGGYGKRVLYLETSLLPTELIGAAVDEPVLADTSLRARVSAVHETLLCADDALEAETRLLFIAERIHGLLGSRATTASTRGAHGAPNALAEQLRAYLDAHAFATPTMTAASAAIGARPTHLARAFASVFGIPPHRYVLGRRLDAARDRILRGQPLADVAAEVGFVDQAHLTHRFRQFLGTTPGAFARSAA